MLDEQIRGIFSKKFITNIPSRPCNVVFNARLLPEKVTGVIKSFIEIAQAKNVPLRWYVGKNTEPANLGHSPISHGFTTDGPVPMMAVDLQTPGKNENTLSGLKIIQYKDFDSLKIWTHTCSRGFGGTSQGEIVMFKWLTKVMEPGLPMTFYLALYKDIY
jgi:hypothetical protein